MTQTFQRVIRFIQWRRQTLKQPTPARVQNSIQQSSKRENTNENLIKAAADWSVWVMLF